ncbi:hypothetical protein HU200_000176 [Digitaria exilis]|uniref:Uncharacterized protein n=1 Tax=Digitaria exilis TaxID=1010633 RepID=A0A835FZ27_9POAL|nr:hypothetical protein HU200_000176 [Digitaria exilis]
MVQEHKDLMEWIDTLLANQNEPFGVDFDAQHHTVLRTANEGLFRIIMRLPPEEISAGKPIIQDLMLAFSLVDLYFLGFFDEDNNKWRFFKDARLEGSGHLDKEHADEWEEMDGIDIGYSDFGTVEVGVRGLIRTHVLKGPAAFEPIFRYLTYADAFSAVSVVSNKLKEKRKVAEAATAVVVTNPAVAFLPDYDFKDDSEGTTSSENVLVAEEGDTTEDELGDAEMMPRRRIQRGQPRMRMPRAQPRRMAPIQRQRKNGKACFFLAVLFLLLLIGTQKWKRHHVATQSHMVNSQGDLRSLVIQVLEKVRNTGNVVLPFLYCASRLPGGATWIKNLR